MKVSTLFAFSFAVIVPAVAASSAGADASRSRDLASDRVAAFRSDFNKVLDHYDGVFLRLGHKRGARLAAEARESLRVVSDEQLAKVLEKMPSADLSPAVHAAEVLASHTPLRTGPAGLTPGFPSAPPILSECDSIVHDSGFTFGALVAFQVVRTVLAAAEFVCQEVIVIL